MVRQRKMFLAFVIVLTAVLALALVLPFSTQQTANAAPPVVEDRESWVNTYSGSYYDNLNTDLTGATFRTELAKLITSTHTTNTVYNGSSSLALNNVWPKSDVADTTHPNNGQIKWFYTGTVTSASNFGGSVGETNREHVWAKNAGETFTAESGPGADAHHLRPTECQLNSSRGNLGFDEVPQTTSNIAKQNNSTSYGTAPDGLCYKNGTYFYPAKGYRGATARILFYMQVRYGNQFSLEFVDGPTTSNGKSIGKISTLLKWHLEEPPNEDEIYRNNIVAGIQGNRNPFIDHPEYAEMIYCNNGKSYNAALKNVVAQYGSYLDGEPTVQPESVRLSVSGMNLTVGATQTVTATVYPEGASQNVNWKSDKMSVATVVDGVVRGVSAGTAKITASSAVNSAVSASFTVTVTAPTLQSLSISPSQLTLKKGNNSQLTVTASPTGASNAVTWNSESPQVATVSQAGIVTAVAQGTAVITATSTENPNIKATIVVTVTENAPPTVQSLSISPPSLNLKKGGTSQLTVTASPTGASNAVTWNSNNAQVATVSNTGVVTAVGQGTAVITATSTENPNVKATVTVTVTEDAPIPPEPPVGDQTDTTAFKNAVAALAEKTTLPDRYAAIKAAIDEYAKLNAAARKTVSDELAVLHAALQQYNAEVATYNAEFAEATDFTAQAVAIGVSSVFLAVVAILAKRFGR